MIQRHRNAGVSLLQLVICTAILGIVMLGIGAGLRFVSRTGKTTAARLEDAKQVTAVSIFLKLNLEGSRSFQNLSFRLPDPVNLSSRGTGFIVEPNRDLLGKSSPGNDRLFVVVSVPTATALKLASPFPGGDLELTATDPGAKLSDLIAVNDLLVLTNIQSSEAIRVTGAPAASKTSVVGVSEAGGAFAHTFRSPASTGSPTLLSQYVAGDFVHKARILAVGLDTDSGEIRGGPWDDVSRAQLLAQGATRFSVSYKVAPPPAGADLCNSVTTPDDGFSRVAWDALNSDSQLNCYTRVREIAVEFQVGPEAARYIFKTNN